MTENAKLIQSMYQAFGRGDIPFILERYRRGIRLARAHTNLRMKFAALLDGVERLEVRRQTAELLIALDHPRTMLSQHPLHIERPQAR